MGIILGLFRSAPVVMVEQPSSPSPFMNCANCAQWDELFAATQLELDQVDHPVHMTFIYAGYNPEETAIVDDHDSEETDDDDDDDEDDNDTDGTYTDSTDPDMPALTDTSDPDIMPALIDMPDWWGSENR